MKLNDLVYINPTNTAYKKLRSICYIDTASVSDGTLTNTQTLTENFPSRAQRKIERGDILISSVRPNLKHNYYVSETIDNAIASTGFIHIRVKDNNVVNPQFLYYWLTAPDKINRYCSIADCSQSAYPSFTKEVIETLDFPSISITTQHSITNTIPYSTFNLLKFSKICLSNSAPSAVKARYSCSKASNFA